MQAANRIHNAMKKGTSFGAWQMLAGTNLARTLTSSGVDWVLVDCEHGNIADSQMHEAVTAIAAQSVSPLVRIPANQDWMVKRVLDAGAHGVMVPLLETADEARQLVRNAKFPPRGRRGFGSPFPMQTFKDVNSAGQYLQEANDSLLTIVQIETKQALANVDEIAAVDGIDCLFVGPFDLGINIGHPITTSMPEELREAIEKVNQAAHAKGKKSGMFCTSGAQAREFADQGFDMISITTDVAALQNYVENEFNAAKGSLAHSAFQMAKGAAQKVSGPYGR